MIRSLSMRILADWSAGRKPVKKRCGRRAVVIHYARSFLHEDHASEFFSSNEPK